MAVSNPFSPIEHHRKSIEMIGYTPRSLVAAFLLAAVLTTEAAAQTEDHRLFAQLSAGVVLPVGEFANTTNAGFGFAGTIGYSLNPRWTLLGAFNGGYLKGTPGPDWNIYSFLLKAAFETGEPGAKWRIMVPLGAGAVTFDPQSDAISTNTYFAVNSGLMFQYYVNPRLALTLDTLATLVFTSQTDLGTDYVWLFPLAAGLLVRL
jgi:hypothetical protein